MENDAFTPEVSIVDTTVHLKFPSVAAAEIFEAFWDNEGEQTFSQMAEAYAGD